MLARIFLFQIHKLFYSSDIHSKIRNNDDIPPTSESRCMAKRITIMLDDDLDKKLRLMQAKKIRDSTKAVSFSHVLNEILRKSLK